jgi:signal transduction histidine kinase
MDASARTATRHAWPAWGAALLWLAAVALAALLLWQSRLQEEAARLEADGRALQRLAAQRADQHDAHFTSLGALVAALPAGAVPLNEVAQGILRFYPRITAIDVVASGAVPHLVFTTRPACDAACLAPIAGASAQARGGTPVPVPTAAGRYLLVKRAGDPAAGMVLAMEVDAARLLDATPSPFGPGDALSLAMPDATPILAQAGAAPARLSVPLGFEATLGSASQPFLLRLARRPSALALLPWGALVGVAVLAGGVAWLGLLLLRSRRAAREARRRAELGEHAARLAHAGRINALGEMASGIAHELNQPLTAILSSSQAALRLAPRAAPGSEAAADLAAALEANVRLARRAGDILARLRGWVAKDLPPPSPLDVNALARGVAVLMRRELEERGIDLALDLAEPAPVALAEHVQAEQVVHNLLRNAAEAVEGQATPRGIVLVTRALPGGGAEIAVQDSGPGVAPEARARLFEPFFTTKPGGMGLGLSLCRTLVEGMGGRIALDEAARGGARFVVQLPGPARRAAAA